MKDFVQLYIELLVVVDPTIYLTEIQERLASDLGLQNDEVPSTAATISRFLLSQSIMRKKCKKVALERFTPENIARRRAFIQWRSSVDPREIFVVDETGIEDFHRNFGRNHSSIPVPQLTPKTPGQKWSVLGVDEFHGVVHAIPFDGSYTSEMFEHAIRHIVLPSLPRDSYVMMDNASIHNDNRLANILQAKNITLVKLPTYSYDLSPIEMVFSVLKAIFSETKACKDTESLQSGIDDCSSEFLQKMLASTAMNP